MRKQTNIDILKYPSLLADSIYRTFFVFWTFFFSELYGCSPPFWSSKKLHFPTLGAWLVPFSTQNIFLVSNDIGYASKSSISTYSFATKQLRVSEVTTSFLSRCTKSKNVIFTVSDQTMTISKLVYKVIGVQQSNSKCLKWHQSSYSGVQSQKM